MGDGRGRGSDVGARCQADFCECFFIAGGYGEAAAAKLEASRRKIMQQFRIGAHFDRRSDERAPSAIEHGGPVRDTDGKILIAVDDHRGDVLSVPIRIRVSAYGTSIMPAPPSTSPSGIE